MRYLLILLLLASCSTGKQIRQKARAERLIEKAARLNPSLLSTETDTVWETVMIRDTIKIAGATYTDTIYQLLPGDTIRVVDSLGRAEARLVWYPLAPQLTLNIPDYVKAVEATVEVPVEVRQTTVKQTKFWRWLRDGRRLLIVGLVILALVLLARFVVPRYL
jgi:hypothetical protein